VLISLQISPEEMKVILSAWDDGATIQANGFKVGGEKYMTIKVPNEEAKEKSLVGKKVRPTHLLAYILLPPFRV
jgi:hypothetical protein